jgi:serralysin
MAIVNIKLTQKTVDYSNDLGGQSVEPLTLDYLFGTVISVNKSNQQYQWAQSYKPTGNQVQFNFGSGAQLIYKGTAETLGSGYLGNTWYDAYGTATASSRTLTIPNLTRESITGSLDYYWGRTNGQLIYESNGGMINSYKTETLKSSLNQTYGNVYFGLDGGMTYDASGNISGYISKFKTGAEKILKSAEITGSFSVSGTMDAPQISGDLQQFKETFYDGSIIEVIGGLSLQGGDILDNDIFSNEDYWGSDDQVNIILPAIVYEVFEVKTGAGNDAITAGGGSGMLRINAGSGDDFISIKDGDVVVDGGSGVDLLSSEFVSIDLGNYLNIENATLLGKKALNLIGHGEANILIGNIGNNSLTGGGGDDSLIGGAGNDTYKITKTTTLTDTILIDESTGSGTDTIDIYEDLDAAGAPSQDAVTQLCTLNSDGSSTHAFFVNGSQTGAFTIKGQVEFIRDHGISEGAEFDSLIQLWYGSKSVKPSASVSMTLGIGTAAEDKMTGTAKSDRVNGFAGSDTIDGKGGNDGLFGGAGNDTYVWSDKYAGNTTISDESGSEDQLNLNTAGYINFEADANGNLLIINYSSINGSRIGTLTYEAGTVEKLNLNLNGKSTIYSSVYLGVFDDTVTLDVSTGTSNYILVAKSDYEFKLGSGADLIVGFAIDNVTVEAGAGNDFINLGSLDEAAGIIFINGGAGADLMIGEAGSGADYQFVVENAKDVVIARGEGNYSIQSSITYALNDVAKTLAQGMTTSSTKYVSNLLLTGATNINGTGNSIGNMIEGNAGNNTLSGLAGNDELLGGAGTDVLVGGAGNDTLTGGSGADTFRFDTALNVNTNLDTITDFVSGTDKISLSKSIFKSIAKGITADNLVAGGTSQVLQANDFLRFNVGDHKLYYDADGSGNGAAVAVIELTGVSTLQASDFIIA